MPSPRPVGRQHSDPRVVVPTYRREDVQRGIVHIGVGGFHRAHQAVYVDELMSTTGDLRWGIVGLGLLPQDAAMRDVLHDQDQLFTVLAKHGDGRLDARVVGSIVDFVLAPPGAGAAADAADRALAVLTDPGVRIVSLTITEGGYHANDATGELALDDALRGDLVAGARPTTAFGFLVEALARRRASGVPAFAIVSCDNIPGNGALTRRVLTEFARLRDPGLAAWIGDQASFPSSMVDRITPATTPEDVALLAEELGIRDAWPVVCEPFRQWVLEDDFPSGRPALDRVGVQLVADVGPYELLKLRMLNGAHQAVGHLGTLLGHRHVHEAVADPLLLDFLRGYLVREAAPTLPPTPGVDPAEYGEQVLRRFANRDIADTLQRLCTNSSDRIPKFLLPVVRHQLRHDGELHRSALVVAAWARLAEGSDGAGAMTEPADRRRDDLRARARRTRLDPLAFLEDEKIFGDLATAERFATAFAAALRSLHEQGARATLAGWTAPPR